MRPAARQLKWLLFPVLVTGLILLSADEGQGQPPPGGGPGRGGFGGFGGPPDPDAMWTKMAQGKDSMDLNQPQNAWLKGMIEKGGDPLPPGGVLTKDQFKASMAKRAAQGGGMGGMGGGKGGRGGMGGGGPGGFGGPQAPGMTPQAVQVVPGQFPPPGGAAPGGTDWLDGRFRELDLNKDGFITADEASDRLRPVFAQADANGDGKIDANEYKGYMSQQMGRGGMGGSGPGGGGMGGPPGWATQQQELNPSPITGGGRNRDKREEEDTTRVSVSRYGKLPKEVPSWFHSPEQERDGMDDDRDGMIGLYEWRRHGKKTAEFVEMDLNADGYLTADEWLRHQRIGIERREQESLADKSPADRTGSTAANTGGRNGPGGDRAGKGGGSTDKTASPEKGGKDKMPGDKGGKGGEKGGKGKDRGPKEKGGNPFVIGE